VDEKPHRLLDRETARADAQRIFGKHLEVLRDLVNYGSNLIPRAYASSKEQLADLVVCSVLLKQVVGMTDSVEALLTEGTALGAHLPARAAFEASVYLEWMLVSDTANKAAHYYVANVRHEKMWAQRAIKGTDQQLHFKVVQDTLGYDLNEVHPELEQAAIALKDETDQILAQKEFAHIEAAFVERKGNKKHDPNWYVLLGPKNLREIADTLKRLPEYELLYSAGSRIVHAAAYKDHVKLGQKQATLKPIRNLEGISTLLSLVYGVAFRTYQRVLGFYRRDELPALSKKYVEDWRQAIQAVPNLTIKYDKT
jgi:hypothetical protein